MVTVGIRNLRNSLSKYINIVKNGEKVLITDHNKIIAELRPSEQIEKEYFPLKEYMDKQIESGSVIQSTQNTVLEKKAVPENFDKAVIERIYNETRNERI